MKILYFLFVAKRDHLVHWIKWFAGYVPFLHRFVFSDANKIYFKERKKNVVTWLSTITPHDLAVLHFNYGARLRTQYLLWHPKNPYTMVKLGKVRPGLRSSSQFHPENYSWAIVRRLRVDADKKKTSLQK